MHIKKENKIDIKE